MNRYPCTVFALKVVYASNQPEQFDWAVNDRIDEMVEFKLPDAKVTFSSYFSFVVQVAFVILKLFTFMSISFFSFFFLSFHL